jgi:hypothetical protein
MKSKPIEHHPDARLEVVEAFDWYELHESGLGERFQSALKEAENFIRRNPQLGSPHKYGTRKRPLKIFPYNLIYSDEPEAVVILAVAHFSRRPDYWRQRAGG